MKKIIKNKLGSIIGVVLGGIAGYVYYHFVGCSTGSYLITSRPIPSIIYGGIMGYLVMSLFGKNKK